MFHTRTESNLLFDWGETDAIVAIVENGVKMINKTVTEDPQWSALGAAIIEGTENSHALVFFNLLLF